MTARAHSREEFRAAWESHIKELTTLAFQARTTLADYDHVKARLTHWLDEAERDIFDKEGK